MADEPTGEVSQQVRILTAADLPEVPNGWGKRLVFHINFGSEGGAATYEIVDDLGRKTNLGFAYDTRKTKEYPRGARGFFVNGSHLMPWKELRDRYEELTRPKDIAPFKPDEQVIFVKRGESREYDTNWRAVYVKYNAKSDRHSIRIHGQKRIKVVQGKNLRHEGSSEEGTRFAN